MGKDEPTDEKVGWERKHELHCTPNFNIHLSDQFLPLKVFALLILHLLAEHADQGDIERGTER